MFGEAIGETDSSSTLSYAWMGCGCLGTGWGLYDFPDYTNFFSYHPEMINFCLADGSVFRLNKRMDYRTFVRMSAIADGDQGKLPWDN